jgi:hypothetical protein
MKFDNIKNVYYKLYNTPKEFYDDYITFNPVLEIIDVDSEENVADWIKDKDDMVKWYKDNINTGEFDRFKHLFRQPTGIFGKSHTWYKKSINEYITNIDFMDSQSTINGYITCNLININNDFYGLKEYIDFIMTSKTGECFLNWHRNIETGDESYYKFIFLSEFPFKGAIMREIYLHKYDRESRYYLDQFKRYDMFDPG